MKARRRASDIYKKQNTVLHRAFAHAGFPYVENKFMWLPLMNEIAQGAKGKGQSERRIEGLSGMTLGERHRLVNHFQQLGYRIYAPAVPAKIRDWKKGDPDINYEFREDPDPQIRMVYAIWNEMGYRPRTLRGLCLKRFGKDDPRWLSDGELRALVNIVKQKAESKGVGKYYKDRRQEG